MVPTIQCKGFLLSDAIRHAVISKSEKITSRADITSLAVTMEKETDILYRVHIEMHVANDGVFNATSRAEDLYAAHHDATNKMVRQIRESHDRHARHMDRNRIVAQLDEPSGA
jgi:ribosomal subunit interface protein